MEPILQTRISGTKPMRGKVRDVYDLGDKLLIVATDRISAFDVVMANAIPYKGIVLTQISKFWFDLLSGKVEHHLISDRLADFPKPFCDHPELAGRSMLVRKVRVLPIECIIRGYLAGSGWKEYQQSRTVCGIKLPAGLRQCDKLPQPIFTPSTKAERGTHDENIGFDRCAEIVGHKAAEAVRDRSIEVFNTASACAAAKGILLADTKFEWGTTEEGKILLVDEVLTPDSSRFWPADKYAPGRDQESFDKQFVRNYLEEIRFNKSGPGVELPPEVVQKTSAKYIEAYERLTGKRFAA
jgi:phosphoribosylaminoimidazole-succinocarboxamide synthase